MRKPAVLGMMLVMLTAAACAYEQPEYVVLEIREGYELREYPSYLVAETTVPGDLDDSGAEAFRILSGYIFGDNQARRGGATEPGEPLRMNMTIPVTAQPAAGGYVYRFVMERRFSMDDLPLPDDDRVRIRRLPERTVAALRYAGRSTAERFERALTRLRGYLERDGVVALGPPEAAYYNGPFTPPFMRRNEVLIEVEPPHDPAT